MKVKTAEEMKIHTTITQIRAWGTKYDFNSLLSKARANLISEARIRPARTRQSIRLWLCWSNENYILFQSFEKQVRFT